jgi:hypothetical protein
LWNAPPDEALLTAAEGGQLETALDIRREAERMLTTTEGLQRARPLVRSAHRSWLGMEGAYGHFWSNTLRDTQLFPEFYPGIDVDFREEVLRFVDHTVFEDDGGFSALLISPRAVVSPSLAPIYGLQDPSITDWTPVMLDPNERPGLLTRAGFVGTHGRFGRGSLIFRGAFVLKRMLCQETGSPPAGADATPLPEGAELLTTRDRIQAMTANEPCRSCHHDRINPAGFPLEAFDGLGRFQTTENGVDIDTTGSIRLDGQDRSYDGPSSYANLLASSLDARACYVRRFSEFTFSLPQAVLGCEGQRLAERMGEPNAGIRDFLVDFVSSDLFLHRAAEEVP